MKNPLSKNRCPDIAAADRGLKAGPGAGCGCWRAVAVGLGFVFTVIEAAQESRRDSEDLRQTSGAPARDSSRDEPEELPALLDSDADDHGVLRDGTAFEDACAVSENAINVIIGRGDADLVIDSPAVSRRHVSLKGTFRELTVSDLGSSNGTSINGVPCLEGEIMFIEPGDVLVLGDARCSLEIRPATADGGEKD